MKIITNFNNFNLLNESIFDNKEFTEGENVVEINNFEELKENVKEGKNYFKFYKYLIIIDTQDEKLNAPTMMIVKDAPRSRFGFKIEANYKYRNIEQLYRGAERFIENELEIVKRKKERQESKKKARQEMKNPYKVGDILYDSWGYDQTNIDFYQVTRTSPKSVWIRPIAAEQVKGSEEFMSARVKPVKDKFIGEEIRKPLQVLPGNPPTYYINSKHGWISKYTKGDEGVRSSWYH